MLVMFLFLMPPRALPPAAVVVEKAAVVHVEVGKIPGVTVGTVKIEPGAAPAPAARQPATVPAFVPAFVPATAPRWVAPNPYVPRQPARRMYYQPPGRSCVNGRCTVTPGYWYYR